MYTLKPIYYLGSKINERENNGNDNNDGIYALINNSL